jgi:hypothetical protein
MSQSHHAYGLPAGSVRGRMALTVFAAIWVLLVEYPMVPVPSYLQNLMFIIMGHYFAAQARLPSEPSVREPPALYLPRGTIRFLLVAGFMFLTRLS